MILNHGFKFKKYPPVWFWLGVFLISISGTFYFGLNPNFIEDWWWVLAAYNIAMSLVAIFYIVISVRQLKRDTKNSVIGSRFTWSFIKIVPVLVIVPVLSFYTFSFQSVQENVRKSEKTFDDFNKAFIQRVDDLYKGIQTVSDNNYTQQTERLLTLIIAYGNLQKDSKTYKKSMQLFLEGLVYNGWACQITLLDSANNIIGETAYINNCGELPQNETSKIANESTQSSIIQVRMLSNYINPLEKSNIIINVIYPIDLELLDFLKVIKYFSDTTKSIRFSANTSITQKRFLIDFSSTILLTILSVLMIVFKMISRLIKPLHNLSLATKEISKGNYDVLVYNQEDNKDMHELITYFNKMSKQIKLSREGLDTHNLYLETILKYSYGVIGLDKEQKIRLINPVIGTMLGIKEKEFIGRLCEHIIVKYPYLELLFTTAKKKFAQKLQEWDEEIEITLPRKRILLTCQGAVLNTGDKTLGYVIIIKDISQLHRAQKKAAWGEVAVRMAHEIKNPLTPILLSAQRLRNKFIPVLKGKDLNIIDKTTNTIIEQVKSMDTMVSAFVDYANTPKINKKPCDLNKLINKTISLYDAQSNINIKLNLSNDIPVLLLDANSISRTLINLIKNSHEAALTTGNLALNINITTKYLQPKDIVSLSIQDNGIGFNKEIIDNAFEPYVTTKMKGSGLGLSIIQNIIEQHESKIYIANIKPHGAIVTIEFNCKQA